MSANKVLQYEAYFLTCAQNQHKTQLSVWQITLSDDDTEDLEEEPDTPEDISEYMDMASV